MLSDAPIAEMSGCPSLRKSDEQLRSCVAAFMSDLARPRALHESSEPHPSATADVIFGIQTRREFCYLSRARTEPYRADALTSIKRDLEANRPIRYYYDIGGGYHASLRPGIDPLCFDVGLGEILLLRQIRIFQERICAVYAPGVAFSLVIDNLAANLINDIAVANTALYCARLRSLIRDVGMGDTVDLLVESEKFDAGDFEASKAESIARSSELSVTHKQRQTVERFMGRHCTLDEVAERATRWSQVCSISEKLLDTVIHGVHMTQRASATTICFRPFPGGDSRIQSGQVALLWEDAERLRPILLTSQNAGHYLIRSIPLPNLLPEAVPCVLEARRHG